MMPEAVSQRLEAARRVIARCHELATCSARGDGIERSYLTPEHAAANELVARWIEQAGLHAHIDSVGNIIGESRIERGKTLMLGSHLDTIPNAGAYDGTLGVVLAIEAAATRDWKHCPYALEVIGFGEEEGSRFGTTMMTSHARVGRWDPDWWQLTDADGVSLANAFTDFGLQPEAVSTAHPEKDLLGYLEVHIEQGPVLEALDLPIGIVTDIVGARRFSVTVTGRAGHAGTVPMRMRNDALVVASQCVLLVEDLANELDVVATVGVLDCAPGAVNVIPGSVTFSLDVRAGDPSRIDAFIVRFLERGRAYLRNGMTLEHHQTHDAEPATCAPRLRRAIGTAIDDLGIPAHEMISGAGHDAMVLARLCDVGMLFVRCEGGVSHHPDEAVTIEDVAWALTALESTLERLETT